MTTANICPGCKNIVCDATGYGCTCDSGEVKHKECRETKDELKNKIFYTEAKLKKLEQEIDIKNIAIKLLIFSGNLDKNKLDMAIEIARPK